MEKSNYKISVIVAVYNAEDTQRTGFGIKLARENFDS